MAIAPLEDHLGYWLRIVSNAVSLNFARRLEREDVTVAEWAFMRMLYEIDSLAPTGLSERMGMTKGAISKLADRLVAKGLVARKSNAADKRAQTLALTQKAKALIPRLAKLADKNDFEFFGVVSATDRAALDRIVRRLAEHHELRSIPTN
jgi:DNA-binding MarR family transcriptional regulator